MKIAGLILLVLGAFALAYQGFTYTTEKKVLDIGPLEATVDQKKTVPLPPVLGGAAMVGGIALLALGKNK